MSGVVAPVLGLLSSVVAQDSAVDALTRLDPVELCAGRELAGEPARTAEYDGYRYYFASDDNRARFAAEPERYGIQWNGGCGRMGPLSGRGSPERWLVHRERIYIFASDQCREGFARAPDRFVPPEEEAVPAAAAALRSGAEWVERAARAHGVAAVDGVLVFARRASVSGWGNEVELICAPDGRVASRSRWTPPDPDQRASETRWILGDAAFVATTDEPVRALGRAAIDDVRRRSLREVPVLLAARARADYRATDLGDGQLGDRAVHDVLVECFGLRTTLHIDPESALVAGISWRGRLDTGVTGAVVEQFTATTDVDGWQIPVGREVTIDAQRSAAHCVTWDDVRIAPATADVFRR